MSLARKFVVMRAVNGRFEPLSTPVEALDNETFAETQAKNELARDPNGRFAIFELRGIAANVVTAQVEPVSEKAA